MDATTNATRVKPVTSTSVTRSLLKRAKANPDKAILDCTKAVEFNSKDVAAWACRAFARQLKGDVNGCFADAMKALDLNPDEPAALTARAAARMRQDDPAGAA